MAPANQGNFPRRFSSTTEKEAGNGQFVPAARRKGATLQFYVDGRAVSAHTGQSILAAMLQNDHKLRYSEFTGEPRAGFCLMNACQDCWMWTDQGTRLRTCSTPVSPALVLYTTMPPHPKDN